MWRLTMMLGAAVLLAGPARPTDAYPVNLCVARKQAATGAYCDRVLKARADWQRDADGMRRERRLARARVHLEADWGRAESAAASDGVDCADTTLSAGAVAGMVDSATGAIVATVNDGLDLGAAREAACGADLLDAAARTCRRRLRIESDHVRALTRDPRGLRRRTGRARASEDFAERYARVRRRGCPTAATADVLQASVDALVTGVVANTIVSPNVDAATFATISPSGTTRYLGRDLRPRCMDGSPYHFFVKRGSVNKLLMYYQGGGACWDASTCSFPLCDANVSPSGGGSLLGADNPTFAPVGFFDLGNPQNPFRDWHVVFVSYCSCDLHFGDATRAYPRLVEHRGFENSRIAEKWAREHFVDPEVVFVAGSSSGSYGARFNAPLHHDVWPASRFLVLADAGTGVTTPRATLDSADSWNLRATLPAGIPGAREWIDTGTGIGGYTEAVSAFFPQTRWAQYTTAFDGGVGGQTGFYNVMLNGNDPLALLTWWEASCAFHEQMRSLTLRTAAAVPSNYRYYIGAGSRHTMWYADKVYDDTAGGVPTILAWVNAMLTGSPDWTNVECADCGRLLPGDPRPPVIPTPPFQQVGSEVEVVCAGGSPRGAFLADAQAAR